jgi:hypothetical protein
VTAATSNPGPFMAINGVRVTKGSLTLPYYGAWVADLEMATPDPLTAAATVTLGALTLKGTIVRTAPYAGARTARVVAGAGGWRSALTARSYQFSGGVKLSTVLGDAATELGERIKVSVDVVLGAAWVRPAQTGAQLLKQMIGTFWWIDNAGVTQVAAPTRPAAVISSTLQVISFDPGLGLYEVATESLQDWIPGASFTSLATSGTAILSSVTFVVDNDGVMRVRALAQGDSVQ